MQRIAHISQHVLKDSQWPHHENWTAVTAQQTLRQATIVSTHIVGMIMSHNNAPWQQRSHGNTQTLLDDIHNKKHQACHSNHATCHPCTWTWPCEMILNTPRSSRHICVTSCRKPLESASTCVDEKRPPSQRRQVIPNYRNTNATNNKKPKSGPTKTLNTQEDTKHTTQRKNKH